MASFLNTVSGFEKVFASPEWISSNIAVFPDNLSRVGQMPDEYLSIEILPSKPVEIEHGNSKYTAGLFIAKIFVPINSSVRRVYQIADILDSLLEKQLLENNIQTSSSGLDIKGNDPDNPALYRADYNISFNSY